jgi:[ribosomal protein S5]-alanine N-acetyltransferase
MDYIIETERLSILPLKKDELIKYVNSPNELAEELNIVFNSETMNEEEKNAILNDLLPRIKEDDDYFYSTIWLIIERSSHKHVGGLCFHGPPEADMEVEIGYGTEPEFQNRGIMTESLKGIIDWLKGIKNVNTLIAKTNDDNISSWRVLEKNNFKKISVENNLITWKIDLTDIPK